MHRRMLTKEGDGEALQHTPHPAQAEVPHGTGQGGGQPSEHGTAQVRHGQVHQSEVQRLPELPVPQRHHHHRHVQHDATHREHTHDDRQDRVAHPWHDALVHGTAWHSAFPCS